MFSKSKSAQRIFDLTISQLPLGPANGAGVLRRDARVLLKKLEKMALLADQVVAFLGSSSIASTFQDLFKRRVLDIVIKSLLAESIGAGVCDDYANLTFLNALIEGLTNVEYIIIRGNPMGHCVVILNRAQPSDLNDPSTWGKACIVIDPWAKKIIYFDSLQNVTAASVFSCVGEILSIKCGGSYNNQFSPQDWNDIYQVLIFLSDHWTAAFYKHGVDLKIEKAQLSTIKLKLDHYMSCIHALSRQTEEEKTAIPVAIKQINNIDSSLNLHVNRGSTGEILFSILPEQSEDSNGLQELKQVLDRDSKDIAIFTSEDVRDWKIDRDWLRQVNDVNPQGISEFCGYFNFNEHFFRKKLNLKSCELVIEHGSREISISLDSKQIEEMEKIATYVGPPIKKIETEDGTVYKVSIEWLRKVNKHNPEGISTFCAKLGFDLDDFIQRIDWYNRAPGPR